MFIIGAFVLLNLLNFDQLTPIEDVSYYERTLSRTTVDKCCEGLLPRHIPKDAENVVFFYTPKFMQGSEEFILAFKADDSTLSSYETKLKENAIWSRTYNQSIADSKNTLVLPKLLLENNHYGELSENATQYLIAASPEKYERNDGYLNHGVSYTVTLNHEANEIVFHYELW